MIKEIIIIGMCILLSGCIVDYEDENALCQAMFENGTYEVDLNETSADNCDEYAGAMIMSNLCKGGLYCEQFNTTCICKRFE